MTFVLFTSFIWIKKIKNQILVPTIDDIECLPQQQEIAKTTSKSNEIEKDTMPCTATSVYPTQVDVDVDVECNQQEPEIVKKPRKKTRRFYVKKRKAMPCKPTKPHVIEKVLGQRVLKGKVSIIRISFL